MQARLESKANIPGSNSIKVNPHIKWNIPVALAQENEAYWRVVNYAFKSQVGHFILQKRKGQAPKFSHFLQESTSFSKAREYSRYIQKGEWTQLNLDDEEFVRDIFMAMRLRKITVEQMATAILLHNAKEQFHDDSFQIKQYHFEEKGPYSPSSVSYATPENLQNFEEQLAKLPKNEQYYFSFNLPRKHAIAFLFDGLNKYAKEAHSVKFFKQYIRFSHFFKKYILQLNITNIQKEQYIFHLKNLANEYHHQKSIEALSNLLRKQESCFSSFMQPSKNRNKDRESIALLIAILRVGEEIPALQISPDYDEKNPNSPLLAFILPTVSALNALQLAIHGEDHRVDPYYVVGKISTRMIRYLDETPYQFGLVNPSRPVELTHPDIKKNEFPHNMLSHHFLLTWHDLFHCWRSSINLYKPLIRHLRRILTDEKGFDMSKAIWLLSDLDISQNREIRQSMKIRDLQGMAINRSHFVRYLLDDIGINFFKETDHHDVNLLLISDILMNFPKWKNLYTDITSQAGLAFFNAYTDMEQIHLNDYKKTGTPKSATFYVLAYRLKNEAKSLELCEKLHEFGLHKIIYWERNGGLCFHDKNHFGCKHLKDLSSKKLFAKLSSIFDDKKNPESYFSFSKVRHGLSLWFCCRKQTYKKSGDTSISKLPTPRP